MYLHHRVSLVLLSFTVAVAASAYPEYRVTVVGPADSWVYGINNAGVVVGDYAAGGDRRRAFLNRGKGLVDLGALTGVWSSASGINDRGEVVGNWRSADGRQRGFIYACGKARDIGTIPGKVTGYSDINDAGYITASGRNPATGETLGYLRAPNGAFTHLGAIDWDGNGAPETVPAALNNRNQITGRSGRFNSPEPGYRAFVWKNGAIRDLGRPGFDAQHRTRDQRPRPDYRPGVPARRPPPPRQHRQWEHPSGSHSTSMSCCSGTSDPPRRPDRRAASPCTPTGGAAHQIPCQRLPAPGNDFRACPSRSGLQCQWCRSGE